MVCLNLPLDIRYKPENMYLAGIIPGPKQPSLETLNHYICPLINDLVDAWQHSIKFSNTTCYPHGWLTHSAVATVVCDLPTAHHIASMAGVSSHFYCSACNCYHKSTCERVDFEKWEPRDREKLQEYAEQWRDAATSSERGRLFKAHGMRYSKLWHLLYWDPSQQLAIDLMHWILEGLVQHHTLCLTSQDHWNFPAVLCIVCPRKLAEHWRLTTSRLLLIGWALHCDDSCLLFLTHVLHSVMDNL